ncbi:hypothetical protein B296_00058838 [Ensete ventricosum]|uniref:Uncharacterized protein n=1 Tax=Ensete ventricosum TaxID=4639 RepID=A0A426XK78_ENSVE|nr:hypothetical protein B296_00058838 [Ensete ventricosum]
MRGPHTINLADWYVLSVPDGLQYRWIMPVAVHTGQPADQNADSPLLGGTVHYWVVPPIGVVSALLPPEIDQ